MNIYRRLGAKAITIGSRDTSPPAVYEDGSCDEQTKIWAMEKIGFNFAQESVELISWVECNDRSNLCPHRFRFGGKHCYGSPEPKQPGWFRVEYAGFNGRKFYSNPIQSSHLQRTLVDCLEKSESLYKRMICNLIVCESNVHDDADFEFMRSSDRPSWLYKGNPVESVHGWFSHLGNNQPCMFQYS